MKQQTIDKFFKLLDQACDAPAEVILVGASAGSLMGHIRPSIDIDFEIRLQGRRAKNPEVRERLTHSIEQIAKQIRVAVNYSENISGWSMIDYLDYRKTAVAYKKFGKLNVKLIAPAYWTIGKMARFHELDIQDITKIIKAKKLKPDSLVKLWARAVRSSDLSLELGQFQEHVVQFLKLQGKKVWGKSFDAEKHEQQFRKYIHRAK